MNSGREIRVGIVDDNKSIVASLVQNFQYSGKINVVLTASDGASLLKQLKSCPQSDFPDAVITDINMPGLSGIELVRLGKALYPDLKFLMLTVREDEDTLLDAIKAGASGYLMKDEKISSIIEEVKNLVLHESAPMSSRMARKLLDLISHMENQNSERASKIDGFGLSTREKEVLSLLVKALDYKTIASNLNISPHTVRKHIANIYDKLHVTSKAQVINLVHSNSPKSKNCKDGEQINIALVDDHQIVLDSLSMMLSTIPGLHIAGKFNDSRDVIPFLKTGAIDILISDINMPHVDGLELAAKILTELPGIKILMLTVSDDHTNLMTAHNLGIQGYVLKKAGKEELHRAICHIMKGKNYYYNDAILAS